MLFEKRYAELGGKVYLSVSIGLCMGHELIWFGLTDQ